MKKSAFLFFFALLPSLALVACIFDSSDSSLVSWLDDQGFPSNYRVETVSIDSIYPVSAAVGFDSTPRKQLYQGVLGNVSGMNHDLVFDFCFRDVSFFSNFKKTDSAAAFLAIYLDSAFYAQAGIADSLPMGENLEITYSWILDKGVGDGYLDSVGNIKDSIWLRELRGWKKALTVDTTYSVKVNNLDSAIRLDLPGSLVKTLMTVEDGARLQLRMSAPHAKRLYRIYGPSSSPPPFIRMRVTDTDFKSVWPFRMGLVSTSEETCKDCLILHGGVLESLVVDIPGERILNALGNLYGDDFPYTEGDSMDVRQAVVLARLTMGRSNSMDGSELGLPVQVAVASFVDSNGVDVQKTESYKLNREFIKESGHPNLVFMEGDSLSLQMTYGMRSYINRAGAGAKLRVVLRMGRSMLAPYDTLYYDHLSNDGKDSVYMFMDYLTYSRYDFTEEMRSPMSLKLWLATKRGDDE